MDPFARLLMPVLAGSFVVLSNAQVLTVQVGTPPPAPTPLVNHTDFWRWHKGTNAPTAGWQSTDDASLDASWGSGPGGFGYSRDTANETNQCLTVLADMSGTTATNYSTFYIRRTFAIDNTEDATRHIQLTVDYDDAFVAYLDGVEVARSANAPGTAGTEPAYTALATSTHESSRGTSTPQQPSVFDLGAVGARTGTHVLALLGLNQNKSSSSDFILIADLALTGGSGGGVVSGPLLAVVQSNSVVLTGSNTVPGSARVTVDGDEAAFNPGNGTWSMTKTLVAGVNDLFVAALDSTGHLLASTNRLVVSEISSTDVGGTLPADTTWSPAMGIIHVTSTAVVPSGGSLTIQPGSVLLMSPGSRILATNATLNATGTAASPVYFLPSNGTTTNWGEIAISGTSGVMLLQHVETIAGHVEVFDGAVGTLEDSYFHDYWTASPAIIHTLGQPNHVTLNMRRCHVARYQEVLSQLATNHIEDCLLEYQGYSGDGIDFDFAQEGSYIKRCTVRRGLIFNTDALDMGEFGANGTRVLIDSCLLHDFIDKGVSMGVQVYVTVTNTLIYNVDAGFGIKDNSEAGVFNCTVANANFGYHEYNKANAGATNGGGHVTNSFNNIIWNITNAAISLLNGSTLVADYTDFQATNWPGTGNFSADPLFVNAATHDYHVNAGSPTLGAGLGGANLGVTFPVGGIPAEPLSLAAVSIGTNPVQLAWVDDSDNEDGFIVEHSTDGLAWQAIGSASRNETNFTDNAGVLGQKYYYRVHATNDLGVSPYSNIASGTKQAAILYVGGTISANGTWGAGVTVVVTSSVTIASGTTITIDRGASVQFMSGFSLTVANGGTLLAQGTSNTPILFTRNGASGTWGHIVVNGGVGSPETRISYARFEFNNTSPCIQVSGGTVFLDHLTFANTAQSYLHLDGGSFVVQGCEFPTATAGFELVHGTGGIKSGGHGIFVRNFFGSATGYNDVVDFTGGNRPGPIIHFIDNVFVGASDDQLDLDGTDAWVEGNIFLHAHKNGSPDTSSAVSGGDDSGATSEITVVGNIMYDCDHAAMGKAGNFYTFINNTVVHQTHVGGTDTDGAVLCLADEGFAQADGMYAEANIIYDAEKLVRFYTNSIVTFSNNLMPFPWAGPGGANSGVDPQLKYIPQLAETYFTNWASAQIMRDWFSVSNTSPAVGTGPDGRDRGGVIPIGASISGEPSGTTPQSNATLMVGFVRTGSGIPAASWPNGSGYTHYKWRLDGGAWSAERPMNSALVLSNLATGPHYVEVTGKRDSLLYQDDPLFGDAASVTRSLTWIVGSGSLDTDGDGMPDDWEIANGFDKNDPSDANLDADGDGMTNLQEYLAGTDPHSGASRLAVIISQPAGNAITLQFNAVANQTYTLLSRTSLVSGVWLPVQNFTATTTNRSIVITTNFTDSARFFEIQSSQ